MIQQKKNVRTTSHEHVQQQTAYGYSCIISRVEGAIQNFAGGGAVKGYQLGGV